MASYVASENSGYLRTFAVGLKSKSEIAIKWEHSENKIDSILLRSRSLSVNPDSDCSLSAGRSPVERKRKQSDPLSEYSEFVHDDCYSDISDLFGTARSVHQHLFSFCLLFDNQNIDSSTRRGGYCSLLFLQATPLSLSWTLEGLFELTLGSPRALTL